MSHTAIMLNGHSDPAYLHIAYKIQPTALPTSHIIDKYGLETHMPLKCHIYMPNRSISSCAYTRQLHQYTCLIQTQCNQQCDQRH